MISSIVFIKDAVTIIKHMHSIPLNALHCINFNLFKLNENFHSYQLGQSISVLRVVGWYSTIKGHSVSKQWIPRSDTAFCLCPTKRTLGFKGLRIIKK